jgi:transcriptional regulator with XRE-family HTH domain
MTSALYDRAVPRTRTEVLEQRADLARRVGQKLALAREASGLTQQQAAQALGVPQPTIAKIESGVRALQFVEGLRLAALYSMNPRELDPTE